jgi:hypothetical protein
MANGGGNLSSNPLFVNASASDFSLQENSPGIDSGDNAYVPSSLTTDLAANPRIENGTVDIGAYEEYVWRDAPSLVVDTTLDGYDFDDGVTTLREAIHYVEAGKIAGSTITFGSSLAGATILLGSQLTSYASLTVDATNAPGLTLDGQGRTRLLYLHDGREDIAPHVTLAGLTLTGGQAESGGAVYIYQDHLNLVNCLVTGNSASGSGGAISNIGGQLNVVNSTITRNTTAGWGGGISSVSGTNIFENSIIWGNQGSARDDIDLHLGWTSLEHCIYGDVAGETIEYRGGNLSANPFFVDATAGNFALQVTSPAVDSGDNALVHSAIVSDIRGLPRTFDGNNDGTATVDIGAFELYGATVDGTENDDVIIITISSTDLEVGVNGNVDSYSLMYFNTISIDGRGGKDIVTILGTDRSESASLAPGAGNLFGQVYAVYAANSETIEIYAASGDDQVTLAGSPGSNRLYSYVDYSLLADSPRTFSHRVNGFEDITVTAPPGGRNYAFFYDSPESDVLVADPDQVVFTRGEGTAEEIVTTAGGFQRVYAYGTAGGTDEAIFSGSATTANRFYGYADYSILTESRRSFYFYARGFDEVTADSPGDGATYAYLHDSPDIDSLSASSLSATMNRATPWSDTTATGFDRVYAYSTRGGNDTATLTGSSTGGNQYRGYPTYSTLTDAARSVYHYARGFSSVMAVGSQSDTSGDRAYLYDSSGDDTFDERFLEEGTYLGGSLTDATDTVAGTYENLVKYFDLVYARSSDRDTNDDTISVEDEELLAYRLIRSGTW